MSEPFEMRRISSLVEQVFDGEDVDSDFVQAIRTVSPARTFVYLTDHTSPADRWQDYRKRIRGEHLRVNEQQMDALQKRFHIQVWPTYILMDRQGRFRELPHNHVEEELLKELEKKN